MTRTRLFLLGSLAGLVAFGISVRVEAQVGIGADLASRYIWRGADYGDSFSIQPDLSYAKGPFEVGVWAAYSISADGASATEIDLYASAAFGPFSIGVTDYHFPNANRLFDFADNGAGGHYLEPFVTYSGPIDLLAGIFAYNDPANSIYIQASKQFEVEGGTLAFSVGGTPTGSSSEPSIYGTSGPGLLVLGISGSKEIEVTDRFSIPISVSFIVNPHDERSFLVVGVSL